MVGKAAQDNLKASNRTARSARADLRGALKNGT